MAIGLNDVSENYSNKKEQYNLRSRPDKKEQTVTPWQDFEQGPDLLEMISKREGGVTKRVTRENYKKQVSSPKSDTDSTFQSAISKMDLKQNYTDNSLSKAIKERAKKCLSSIPKPF